MQFKEEFNKIDNDKLFEIAKEEKKLDSLISSQNIVNEFESKLNFDQEIE